jgi:hypothetical protein
MQVLSHGHKGRLTKLARVQDEEDEWVIDLGKLSLGKVGHRDLRSSDFRQVTVIYCGTVVKFGKPGPPHFYLAECWRALFFPVLVLSILRRRPSWGGRMVVVVHGPI